MLTKVYGENPVLTTHKLVQFASGPIVLVDLDASDVATVLTLSDAHALDLTDAILLHLVQRHGASYLATEDQRLSTMCAQFGITALSPVDATLRRAVVGWEAAHLPRRAYRACPAGYTNG